VRGPLTVLSNDGETKRRLQQTEKDIGVEYDFDERPWLQLMCCALVSSHKVGHLFQSGWKLSEQRS